MTIQHHPDVSTLMTCSAGATPEALCAVVASHLSLCPDCLGEIGRMQAIGLTLFENLEPEALDRAPEAVASILASVRSDETDTKIVKRGDVPAPLVCILGQRLDDLAWSELGNGIDQYVVPLSPTAQGDLRLIRMAPGASLPAHGHNGEELTILLRGAYTDEQGTFQKYDFSECDDSVHHNVRADAIEGCILLMASETKPEFLMAFEQELAN